MKFFLISFLTVFLFNKVYSQDSNHFITNVKNRSTYSLNGYWKIIVDPYENGYYNYRYEPRGDGYFENKKPKDKSDLVEYNFDNSDSLKVPGDWNTQDDKYFFYEGTIWYKKSFKIKRVITKRYLLHFGAVNYDAKIYLNGKKLGEHEGGFTPFNFEITDLLKEDENFVVVKVDNKRKREGVPTLNTDWWNYGGITRDVNIIEVPETFIQDYSLQLKNDSKNNIDGWIKLNGSEQNKIIKILIPEIKVDEEISADKNGLAYFHIKNNITLWSPKNPKLYEVQFIAGDDTLKDQIGFRTIKTKGSQILLNGEPIFLRGISVHEESPIRKGRAFNEDDAITTLKWAKELGCNYIRLAHYPHNENIIRIAEKMGIMIWAEIPVYWTILWENEQTLKNAINQLTTMIVRDKNRASVIIWSVANETPRGEARLKLLKSLIDTAKSLDNTRLITAATELSHKDNTMIIDDPLGAYLDVIGVNEYIGWYGGKPEDAPKIKWENSYNKPLIISEFGGGAKYGLHGNKNERWTEEYQAYIYEQQLKMIKTIPFLKGISPWILTDFRSPRRPLPGIQDFWNRKGLISEKGEKKMAFFILQNFYQNMTSK